MAITTSLFAKLILSPVYRQRLLWNLNKPKVASTSVRMRFVQGEPHSGNESLSEGNTVDKHLREILLVVSCCSGKSEKPLSLPKTKRGTEFGR